MDVRQTNHINSTALSLACLTTKARRQPFVVGGQTLASALPLMQMLRLHANHRKPAKLIGQPGRRDDHRESKRIFTDRIAAAGLRPDRWAGREKKNNYEPANRADRWEWRRASRARAARRKAAPC